MASPINKDAAAGGSGEHEPRLDNRNLSTDHKQKVNDLSEVTRGLLEAIKCEDPDRDGLRDTPLRFAKALMELTEGYDKVPEEEVGDAIFDEDHDELVLLRGIPVYSLCEHHLLPFFGHAHIAYQPNPKVGVIGLSKFKRLVDIFARRLQVQERLTTQIMEALNRILQPLGVAVIMECRHMCMEMRGVESQPVYTTTKKTCGVFSTPDKFAELCSLLSLPDPLGGRVPTTSSTLKSCCFDSGCPHSQDQSDDYRLYQRCAKKEAVAIANVIQESVVGPISIKNPAGLSLLDIGAGNGKILEALMHGETTIAFYKSFEMDASLCEELQATATSLGFNDKNALIRSDQFDLTTSIDDIGGPSDVVLLSHSLYGAAEKEELVDHALELVAPGGVLLIIHRWVPNGALDQLCEHLSSRSILYHLRVWDVDLDLSGLDLTERSRISRYTKTDLEPKQQHVVRTIGCIAIEPHSCNLGNPVRNAEALLEAKGRVGFFARKKNPDAVVKPNTIVGIQSCLRAASLKSAGCGSVAVIGGGHSENAFAENAIVINMQLWDKVEVDPSRRLVKAGGGVRNGSIVSECEKHGLVVPLGDRPGVGAGLILQGGLNHFMRRFGLVIDNIVQVVYVSPTGELRKAITEEELFPFRGAGSNFGVVLEVTLRAFPVKFVLAQDTEYALYENSAAGFGLEFTRVAESLPETVCLDGFIFWSGNDQLSFATSYFDIQADHPAQDTSVKTILSLGYPTNMSRGELCRYSPSQLFDRELYMTPAFAPDKVLAPGQPMPKKLRSFKRCVLLPPLLQDHESILLSAMQSAPSKWSYIHLLHGGESATKGAPTTTAFGCRSWLFAAVITTRWPDDDEEMETRSLQWLQATTDSLLPLSVGVYGADLGPNDTRLARLAFGPNSLRLAELKRALDPLNVLRSACPILGDNDPRVQSRGVVVVFCGRRCTGKDWLAEVAAKTLSNLICKDEDASDVTVIGISDEMKKEYVRENHSANAGDLFSNRAYKESHRKRLGDFYRRRKAQDVAYDAKCYVNAIQQSKSPSGILLLTGMRDGLDYARSLAGRAVVLVKVESPDEARSSRGWHYDAEIDSSTGENTADRMLDSFWDLVYFNEKASTSDAAETWVRERLAPLILKNCTRHLPDTPQPGVLYRDVIGSLLLQPFAMPLYTSLVVDWISRRGGVSSVDAVLAPEALGFAFAGSIASALKKPLVLVRKEGKLPGDVQTVACNGSNMHRLCDPEIGDFSTKNKESNFEITAGAVAPGQRVLVVDDCLASGCTVNAVTQLVALQGGRITKLVCVMEFPDLLGRQKIHDEVETFSLMQFDGI